MTKAFVTDPGNTRPKIRSAARRGVTVFAAFASLAMLAAPIHGAFGAQGATQVRNVDDPGRIPYQSTLTGKAGNVGSQFFFQFPAVPAGHRLVIQHIGSNNLSFKTAPQREVRVSLDFGGGTSATSFFVAFSGRAIAFDQLVQFYGDAGDKPAVSVVADEGNSPAEDAGSLTLTGYLLDCKAAPCAAIAE
jgi:hypothetical protein